MKIKLALVGIAHFLTQGLQVQKSVEVKELTNEKTQSEVAHKKELPDIFEQKLRDSKGETIIASPSHETSVRPDGDHGNS